MKQHLDQMLTVGRLGAEHLFYLTLVCPLSGEYDLVIHSGRANDPMHRVKLANGDADDVFACVERVYAYETPEVRAMTRRLAGTMKQRPASVLLVIRQLRTGEFYVTDVHEHVRSLWP
ncbi:MAG TPA: hypothetical protein VFH06_01500 [Candidatus Saccharimonadales bacterium]|nr:hypothetical protein [Candidatus Saccharimonadales bacterium]